ncbi:carboxylesterase/lipase family protein [Streptomyces sp. NPDC102467]|uniref:carboxylesterase/lipase family protein n=1 Tax=Streptomyces sp. NPDC102467 TaxID=3366179 RepID=UPI00380F0927
MTDVASPFRRRSFLVGAVTTTAALTAPRAFAQVPTAGESVRTRTTAGVIAGRREGQVAVFRGVPYARPPVGELRFAGPRPPVAWSGVRDATAYASAFYQLDGSGSEDALYANVWTPGTGGARPVVVYIHGGGWQAGAGSLANYNGAQLAARTDMVVVTFNYRLGGFGWGLHEELADPGSGSCANWGLQDQVALVKWVQDNAAAFGGDPGNITLVGTSAGGASTYQLAFLPQLRGVVQRIVPISAAHAWSPAISLTPSDARTVYEALAAQFGTDVRGLRSVPGPQLQAAWQKVFSGAPAGRIVDSGREYRGPVPDGTWLPAFDYQRSVPRVPVLSVHARTEGSFFTYPGGSPQTPPAPADEAELRTAVRDVLLKGATTVTDAQVRECVSAYRTALTAESLPVDPVSVWTEVWGDGLFRYQVVRLAERHARQSGTRQYVMEFAHPVNAPSYGTPHEATSKFLFGSYSLPENQQIFGNGPLEAAVSRTFMDLVASFARTGTPAAANAPSWPGFSPDRPSTMILGGPDVTEVATTPKLRQLTYWDTAGWVPRP